MPQQHPGRLQVLVVDTRCERRLFSTTTPTDRDACPPFLHAGQLSRGGTTRQQISFPSGACPGQPQPLAQGTSFPPSASAGLAIMNKN